MDTVTIELRDIYAAGYDAILAIEEEARPVQSWRDQLQKGYWRTKRLERLVDGLPEDGLAEVYFNALDAMYAARFGAAGGPRARPISIEKMARTKRGRAKIRRTLRNGDYDWVTRGHGMWQRELVLSGYLATILAMPVLQGSAGMFEAGMDIIARAQVRAIHAQEDARCKYFIDAASAAASKIQPMTKIGEHMHTFDREIKDVIDYVDRTARSLSEVVSSLPSRLEVRSRVKHRVYLHLDAAHAAAADARTAAARLESAVTAAIQEASKAVGEARGLVHDGQDTLRNLEANLASRDGLLDAVQGVLRAAPNSELARSLNTLLVAARKPNKS